MRGALPVIWRRVPWGLVVLVAAFFVPALGSRFYTFLANDIAIWALFATSLNLLVGYTGLVSFGHAAYFGIGAYATGMLMKKLGGAVPRSPSPPPACSPALFALVFGFFCVRLTRIYFAMLTLAFAQIVWAICFKWNERHGRRAGDARDPLPELRLGGAGGHRRALPRRLAHLRVLLLPHPRPRGRLLLGAAPHRVARRSGAC